jgi:hypothetical protein
LAASILQPGARQTRIEDMGDPNMIIEEFARFYKVNREGLWHKKSPLGSYEEMKSQAALKRLRILTAKSLKRIE